MNALQVNAETGFLESPSPANATFTSDKKVKFLEMAKEFRLKRKFPDVSAICDEVGIDLRSFERHIHQDEAFKNAWNEIASHIEYQAIAEMSDLRQKNPMFMFGLLRYLNPQRWNPASNANQSGLNVSIFVDNVRERQATVDTTVIDATPTEKM